MIFSALVASSHPSAVRHFQALAGPDLVHVQVGTLGIRTPVVILSIFYSSL